MRSLIELVENGRIPDLLTRAGIRLLMLQRLREQAQEGPDQERQAMMTFVEEMRQSPIALHTQEANEQHYELPPRFFELVLGPHLKYSCCHFPEGVTGLEYAEASMLALTCERAQLQDGQQILELGCGWGSLSLWMAKHYPNSSILAVSNSRPQREFIESRAQELGLTNLSVQTCDMNDFTTEQHFDRVVSVEMFEHMRNWQSLLERISDWLKPEGKLFIHIFSHRRYAYAFSSEGDSNWMGRYFFTGGIMPSNDLLLYFQKDLLLEQHWVLSGVHYQRTADAWLQMMDSQKGEILQTFRETYGKDADVWFQRWRMFFLATSEVWGFRGGNEWLISHYLFNNRR
ncbi:MAG: class I SAM-dependent methyltransferase [Deltaproteobacteria bacterium]|nr:class I SAM-dependent methyltransferase [Deltaproteobacteria bacterium]MBT7202126.1 class I SAM-dependent methyltransferase [Deltaproteobacteria bacterium]